MTLHPCDYSAMLCPLSYQASWKDGDISEFVIYQDDGE